MVVSMPTRSSIRYNTGICDGQTHRHIAVAYTAPIKIGLSEMIRSDCSPVNAVLMKETDSWPELGRLCESGLGVCELEISTWTG